MKFWLTVGGIALVLLLLPYIRTLFKRIRMAYQIKKACRDNGYTFRAAHPFWILARNNDGHADFYCTSEKRGVTYAVNLVGAPHRMMTLYLIDGDRYRWKRLIPLFGRSVGADIASVLGNYTYEQIGRIRRWKPVDYAYRFRDDAGTRVIPVLLGNPVPLHVMRTVEAKESDFYPAAHRKPLFSGKTQEPKWKDSECYDCDVVWDAYLFSARGFLRELAYPVLS